MSVVVIVLAKRVLSKDKVFSNLMVWDLIRLRLQNLMDRLCIPEVDAEGLEMIFASRRNVSDTRISSLDAESDFRRKLEKKAQLN
jgi:hypothetical protein